MIPVLVVELHEHLKAKLEIDRDFRLSTGVYSALQLPALVMLSGMLNGLPPQRHGFSKSYEMLYGDQAEHHPFHHAFAKGSVLKFSVALYHLDSIQVDAVIEDTHDKALFIFRAVFEKGGSGGLVGSSTIPATRTA